MDDTAHTPRVLLVAPPWQELLGDFRAAARFACVSPPQGLTYLAGALLQDGAECTIVDMEAEGVGAEELLGRIALLEPHLVGITATTPVYHTACELAAQIKARRPELPLALGGVHATIMGRQVLEQCPHWDLVVTGEGEQTVRRLAAAVARPGAGRERYRGIRGVIYRRGDQVAQNPPRPATEDLDSIPSPARHLLDRQRYGHVVPGKGHVRYASLFTSRGCPYRCVFCSQHTMYGRRMRYHSVERVMAELTDIVVNQGVGHVVVMDENLALDRRRLMSLCRAIQRSGLDFTWEGWTHAATVDRTTLTAMRAAGMTRICFGIESGHPQILRRIKKGLTLAQIRRAFRLAREVGLETRGAAMLGHPGETRQTAWATIRFVRGLRHCQQLFLNFACPYPGTELYDLARRGEDGLRLLTTDFSRYQRYGDPVIAVNDLGPKELKRLQRLGLLMFYATPARAYHNLVRRAGLRGGLLTGAAFLQGIYSSWRRG